MKKFASVTTKYYKQKEAIALLDHAASLRNGFTHSINVHPEYTSNNMGLYISNCTSPRQAFEKMLQRYKDVTGKKPRVDFNALFEHVVILSEGQVKLLEQKYGSAIAHRKIMQCLACYAKLIKREFGFEPFAIDLHNDEGRYEPLVDDTRGGNSYSQPGEFVRNCHAHIQFFNYDFAKKISPLRHLMKKGQTEKGRTNQLNPNFEKMQDLAAVAFASLGFVRGLSKNITGKPHLEKEEFIKIQLQNARRKKDKLTKQSNDLLDLISKRNRNIEDLESEVRNYRAEKESLKQSIAKLKGFALDLEKSIFNRCRASLLDLNRKLKSIKHSPSCRR